MEKERPVQCVRCRATYLAAPKSKLGCPHCGGLTWVSAQIAEAATRD